MSKSYVFIQNLISTKEPKIGSLILASQEEAKQHVQRLLDGSIDVASVDMYEIVASAKKVTETIWN